MNARDFLHLQAKALMRCIDGLITETELKDQIIAFADAAIAAGEEAAR